MTKEEPFDQAVALTARQNALEDIYCTIRENTGYPEEAVLEEETSIEELLSSGVDSLSFLFVISELDLRYGQIPDEALAKINTLGELADFLLEPV